MFNVFFVYYSRNTSSGAEFGNLAPKNVIRFGECYLPSGRDFTTTASSTLQRRPAWVSHIIQIVIILSLSVSLSFSFLLFSSSSSSFQILISFLPSDTFIVP